jgi:hypothetical protein
LEFRTFATDIVRGADYGHHAIESEQKADPE